MDLKEAPHIINLYMDMYGLFIPSPDNHIWTWEFSSTRRAAGSCYYSHKLLRFSRYFFYDNPEELCVDVILHEIAHALVGERYGHGAVWQQKCIEIGARPHRCTPAEAIHRKLSLKWIEECPECHSRREVPRRRNNAACGKCCSLYNNNKYSDKYKFVYYRIGGVHG